VTLVSPSGIVTFTTDYGTRDHYVAEMKGAMLCRSRQLTFVDVTHDVPAQDVLAATWQVAQAAEAFPAGTVHLALVDPGVGSEDRGLAIACMDQYFVGPDNGIFSHVLFRSGNALIRSLDGRKLGLEPSCRTFFGRDLYGPAAALLASGALSFRDLGPVLRKPVRLPDIEYRRDKATLLGNVIHVDVFGNLVTSIPNRETQRSRVTATFVGTHRIRDYVECYSDRPAGTLVAMPGSSGFVEISAINGSAAVALGAGRGTSVRVHLRA
jgi:S-adenosylmethionine hydrolase